MSEHDRHRKGVRAGACPCQSLVPPQACLIQIAKIEKRAEGKSECNKLPVCGWWGNPDRGMRGIEKGQCLLRIGAGRGEVADVTAAHTTKQRAANFKGRIIPGFA